MAAPRLVFTTGFDIIGCIAILKLNTFLITLFSIGSTVLFFIGILNIQSFIQIIPYFLQFISVLLANDFKDRIVRFSLFFFKYFASFLVNYCAINLNCRFFLGFQHYVGIRDIKNE